MLEAPLSQGASYCIWAFWFLFSIMPVFVSGNLWSFVNMLTIHLRPPCLISYIYCRLLSANGLLMPPVKTGRGGLGSAPACPHMGDFPDLHCLFLLRSEEQGHKYAFHHSHCTMLWKKSEANYCSLVPIFRYDSHNGQILWIGPPLFWII